jgi:hypothetical protein
MKLVPELWSDAITSAYKENVMAMSWKPETTIPYNGTPGQILYNPHTLTSEYVLTETQVAGINVVDIRKLSVLLQEKGMDIKEVLTALEDM